VVEGIISSAVAVSSAGVLEDIGVTDALVSMVGAVVMGGEVSVGATVSTDVTVHPTSKTGVSNSSRKDRDFMAASGFVKGNQKFDFRDGLFDKAS
jgi:hypothetical protein